MLSKLQFRLNIERASELVEHRFGGVRKLLDAWATSYSDGVPDRSTVYGWFKTGRLPRSLSWLLRLAYLLDCDPVLLIDFGCFPKASHLDAVLRSAVMDLPEFTIQKELLELYGPQDDWPSSPRLKSLSGQSWYICEFEHHGKQPNTYQTLEIAPQTKVRPLAWYFAYRPGQSDLWRPYGMLTLEYSGVVLNNFYAPDLRQQAMENVAKVYASTWFGFSPCSFRVASVHPFALRLIERDEPNIRFSA